MHGYPGFRRCPPGKAAGRRITTALSSQARQHLGPQAVAMSDDRLILVLQYLAILLFLSAGALPLAHGRHAWAKWARWGSIAIFTIAVLYAVVLVLRWTL